MKARFDLLASIAVVSLFSLAHASGAPRDPLAVPRGKVLVTTTITAGPDLTATLTEFFTGEKSEKSVIDFLLGLHRVEGGRKTLVASRDYVAEGGGFVSRGSLQIVDLDRDGTSEVLVEYHHKEAPGSTRVDLDVFRIGSGRFVLAWSGPVRVDTTRATPALPPADRERFDREIEFTRTLAQMGRKLAFRKTVSVAAGAVLDPPRVVFEEVDLAGAPESGPGPEPGTEAEK